MKNTPDICRVDDAAPPAAGPPRGPAVAQSRPSSPAPRAAGEERPAAFGPFRGVFRKELRENARYVVLLLLALAAATFAALWFETYAFSRPVNQDSVLFSAPLQMLSLFVCPVAALLLANFQGFNVRSEEIRGFMRQRALTPTRLFWAKSAAGLTLYFAAIGLPLVILVAYAALARGGGFLFDFRFTRPFVADFVTGIAYYFAGFIVAHRPARWYASRMFPIPAAIAASVCSVMLPEFWQAVVTSLSLAIVLSLAAWHNLAAQRRGRGTRIEARS